MTKKYWSFADAPPLLDISSHQEESPDTDLLVDNVADNTTSNGAHNDREWYRRR
jgi:hypothetical protein